MNNGFICSHSLAVMYLECILNVEMFIGSIEQPRKPGRPRKHSIGLNAVVTKKTVKQSKASKKQQKQFLSTK